MNIEEDFRLRSLVSFIIMCGGILSPTGLAPRWIYFITFLPGSILFLIICWYELKDIKASGRSNKMDITLIKSGLNEASMIHEMQIKSFMPLLHKYQDYETSPANESVERIIDRLN